MIRANEKAQLTPEYLSTEKPSGYLDHWSEYSRVGMILDDYTMQEKIDYLLKYTHLETALDYFLEEQITLDIIARKSKANKGENKLWPTGKKKWKKKKILD